MHSKKSHNLDNKISVTDITDVQFINISPGNPGPVQVQYFGEWYHLCADTDYTREALVICRQMGYLGGWAEYFESNNSYGFNLLCDGMFLLN